MFQTLLFLALNIVKHPGSVSWYCYCPLPHNAIFVLKELMSFVKLKVCKSSWFGRYCSIKVCSFNAHCRHWSFWDLCSTGNVCHHLTVVEVGEFECPKILGAMLPYTFGLGNRSWSLSALLCQIAVQSSCPSPRTGAEHWTPLCCWVTSPLM